MKVLNSQLIVSVADGTDRKNDYTTMNFSKKTTVIEKYAPSVSGIAIGERRRHVVAVFTHRIESINENAASSG